ncbi:hypothetical protein [Streptomyces sp. NPDC001054]
MTEMQRAVAQVAVPPLQIAQSLHAMYAPVAQAQARMGADLAASIVPALNVMRGIEEALPRFHGLAPVLQAFAASLPELDLRMRSTALAMADSLASVDQTAWDTTGEDEIDEELAAELESQAREFPAAEGLGLSREMQQKAFALYIAFVVMSLIAWGWVASETFKEIVEDTSALAPMFVVAMTAAGAAFDRANPPPARPATGEEAETDDNA